MEQTDKRKFPRVAAHATVLVESSDAAGLEELARTSSLGRGGCAFFSAEAVAAGAPLSLLISAGHEVVRVRGQVAHASPVEGGWDVGVEFLDLSEADAVRVAGLLDRG